MNIFSSSPATPQNPGPSEVAAPSPALKVEDPASPLRISSCSSMTSSLCSTPVPRPSLCDGVDTRSEHSSHSHGVPWSTPLPTPAFIGPRPVPSRSGSLWELPYPLPVPEPQGVAQMPLSSSCSFPLPTFAGIPELPTPTPTPTAHFTPSPNPCHECPMCQMCSPPRPYAQNMAPLTPEASIPPQFAFPPAPPLAQQPFASPTQNETHVPVPFLVPVPVPIFMSPSHPVCCGSASPLPSTPQRAVNDQSTPVSRSAPRPKANRFLTPSPVTSAKKCNLAPSSSTSEASPIQSSSDKSPNGGGSDDTSNTNLNGWFHMKTHDVTTYAENAPCDHSTKWKLLRVKKGTQVAHLLCTECGGKWKTNGRPSLFVGSDSSLSVSSSTTSSTISNTPSSSQSSATPSPTPCSENKLAGPETALSAYLRVAKKAHALRSIPRILSNTSLTSSQGLSEA